MTGGAAADRRSELLGLPIDLLTMDETVAAALEGVKAGRLTQHGALNAAKLVKAQDDSALRDAVASCDIITADGQAVVWAGRLLGVNVPERVTGIDLMDRLLRAADDEALGVYLLGAERDVVSAVAEIVRTQFPNARLVGYQDGYYDRAGELEVVAEIAAAQPDLLFVALQSPEKEIFLATYRAELGHCFAMGVGGTFDVMAGMRKRAPKVLQRFGLEWLFRLAQEPRRLLRRYAVGNARFVALVLRAWAGRMRSRNSAPT
jgi:N-acetylglucosaminyldiphosphoundecaprenol N-acetyl-beta-D-mannosaminyltransferase